MKELLQGVVRLDRVVGITVIGYGTVVVNYITDDAIALGSVPIPPVRTAKKTSTTLIRSIQCKRGLLVVSLDGTFTTPVKDVITAIGNAMMRAGTAAAFFPATTRTDCPGTKYFGFAAANLRNLDERVHNVRLLDDGNGIIFSTGSEVRRVPMSSINEDWVQRSTVIHKAPGFVRFLGRIDQNLVPVTLSSGQAYFMDVRNNQTKKPLEGLFSKVFGSIGLQTVALSDSRLVFV